MLRKIKNLFIDDNKEKYIGSISKENLSNCIIDLIDGVSISNKNVLKKFIDEEIKGKDYKDFIESYLKGRNASSEKGMKKFYKLFKGDIDLSLLKNSEINGIISYYIFKDPVNLYNNGNKIGLFEGKGIFLKNGLINHYNGKYIINKKLKGMIVKKIKSN